VEGVTNVEPGGAIVTTLSHRHLRRLSSLVVVIGAAGALAAPSAVARPVDMKAGIVHIAAYKSLANAQGVVGVRGHNGPAPYQGAIRPGAGPLVVKQTASDGGGASFSWGSAGIGAGSAVLATGLLLLVGREATRRRVRVSQA
jgi:hypothetical protein